MFRLIIILLAFPFLSSAQNIRYAKGIVPLKDDENVIIAGKYHDTLQVLKQNRWGAIDVYLYSSDLVLKEKKVLQKEDEGYATIEIIPYSNFYFALLRYVGKNRYHFLKVNASGDYEDLTGKAKELLSNGSTLQKVQTELLFITGYCDTTKSKGFFSIYSADSLLAVKSKHLIELDYKLNENIINYLVFPDTATACIVKSFGRRSNRFGELDILKFDLSRNTQNTLTLSSHQDIYDDVNFKYNGSDSTFLLVTRVKGKMSNNKDSTDRYYCTRMNKELEELMPPVLVQVKSTRSERLVFLIDQYTPLVYENNTSIGNTYSSMYQDYDWRFYRGVPTTIEGGPFRDLFELQYIDAVTRRLTLPYQLNDDLTRTDVSMRIISLDRAGRKNTVLLKAKNGRFESEFFNCYLSKDSDKHYIFYSNRFSVSRGGINYVSVKNGVLGKEEILLVNQQCEYFLPLAKKFSEDFIIPYKQKGELGLLKVSF